MLCVTVSEQKIGETANPSANMMKMYSSISTHFVLFKATGGLESGFAVKGWEVKDPLSPVHHGGLTHSHMKHINAHTYTHTKSLIIISDHPNIKILNRLRTTGGLKQNNSPNQLSSSPCGYLHFFIRNILLKWGRKLVLLFFWINASLCLPCHLV